MTKKPTQAQTIKALDSCIRRWDRIAKGKTHSDGSRTCALCKLYIEESCAGCPVKAVTGGYGCYGTPWEIFVEEATADETDFFWADSQPSQRAARLMLNFLKAVRTGFRPKNTTRKDSRK